MNAGTNKIVESQRDWVRRARSFLARITPAQLTGRETRKENALPQFSPSTLIRDWGLGDAFRISDALTGVCCFGSTGSGKSSAVAKHLAYGYLSAGLGGCVLCAKPDEKAAWQQAAKDTGRSDDLVIIDASGKWRFNPLAWEAERRSEGGGFTINVVSLLEELGSLVTGAGSKSGTEHGDSFWKNALSHMCFNLVDLPVLAGLEVSLPLLREIVNTAPLSPEQVEDPQWNETSTCAAVLREAAEVVGKPGTPAGAIADFEECRTYWLRDFPNLAERTRSIVTLMFGMMVRPLLSRPLRDLFCSDTNIKPEDTFDGKVLIIDIPVQSYLLAGLIANCLWKRALQIAILRRTPPTERNVHLRPVFLWADECQYFLNANDAKFQAVARSAGGCTVLLTQNRASLRTTLGNNDAVDALLGNLQTLVFCANTCETNEWASNFLGARFQQILSVNAGESRSANSDGSHSSGVNRAEQQRNFLEPSMFTTLKRGGAAYNFQVQAVVYKAGHQYANASGELLPYRLLTFNQK